MDLIVAKLYVFIDSSFTNNQDLSSQIGFVVILGAESERNTEFTLTRNLIYTSSTKCKRVTRAILVLELHVIVARVDMLISLATTIDIITSRLSIPKLLTVVYIDFLSLYECIIKLRTTKEKRLMIDIIVIRQSYKRRELTEMR